MEDVEFQSCGLVRSSFVGASLTNVRFVGCDLRRSVFSRSRLKNVEFVDCYIDGISLVSVERFEEVGVSNLLDLNGRLLVGADDQSEGQIRGLFDGFDIKLV